MNSSQCIDLENRYGARQCCEKLKENGLLCKETHEHIIRFAPPLVITKEQVEWAVEKIGTVITT